MNPIAKQSTLTTLPLLVHTKIATFEWGKSVIDSLYMNAKKQGLSVRIMYTWQEVLKENHCSFLIVLGVDQEWLDEVFRQLDPLNLRFVLIDGILNQHYDNISQIHFDKTLVYRDVLTLLRSRGRTRTAFFGVQKNDTSDAAKAAVFAKYASSEDIYHITEGIDACFEAFLANLSRYDSVICSNDIIAVYFLSRCLEHQIPIPEQLYLVGNSDLWISSHVTPALTTIPCNIDAMTAVTIQICQSLDAFPNVSTMDVSLNTEILERASTGGSSEASYASTSCHNLYQYEDAIFAPVKQELCPEIQKIKTLDQILSACSVSDLKILQRLAEGYSYEEISEEVCISIDTVRYHIKKLYRLLDIHKRQELKELLAKYSLKLVPYTI